MYTCVYTHIYACVYIHINLFYFVGKALSHSICVFRCPTMETPLDVLSRAASFVHANEEEGKCHSSHRRVLAAQVYKCSVDEQLTIFFYFLIFSWLAGR